MSDRSDLPNNGEGRAPVSAASEGPPRPGLLQRTRRWAVVIAVVVAAAMAAVEARGFLGSLLSGIFGPSLAPDAALAQVQQDRDTKALDDLRARFPHDPRVLILSSFAAKDRAEAEQLLRAALDEKRTLRKHFPDGKLEALARSLLARLLRDRDADAEARAVLRPSCGPQLEGIADRSGLAQSWVTEVCTGSDQPGAKP
jgi:hypothetical protein